MLCAFCLPMEVFKHRPGLSVDNMCRAHKSKIRASKRLELYILLKEGSSGDPLLPKAGPKRFGAGQMGSYANGVGRI